MHRLPWYQLLCLSVSAWGFAACTGPGAGGPAGPRDGAAELTIEQERTYRETKQGRFLSLADFEAQGHLDGRSQAKAFNVFPPGDGRAVYTTDRARTGGGALAVTVPARRSLVFAMPASIDLGRYTLLTMALYSEAVRDDLRVTLMSDAGSWTSPPALLRPGWNHVRFDIQRLSRQEDFDIGAVGGMRLRFADSASPVRVVLDDLLLVDNRETISPTPPQIDLKRIGLDYHIRLPGPDGIVQLVQSDDGLWRLGVHQATVKFAAPGEPLPFGATSLERLGEQRIGDVELLEHNTTRVRLAATWYFPARAGEWVSQGVRHIRWEYTICSDGRWITHMRLNNAGGQPIGTVSVSVLGRKAAWAGDGVRRNLLVEDFVGPVAQWDYLVSPTGPDAERLRENYLQPARIEPKLARAGVIAPGDANADHFDESQGCYVLAAERGHCRFRVIPPAGGLLRGICRILGEWGENVSIHVDGEVIRRFSRTDDAVLFELPGLLTRPSNVEVRHED